MNAKKFSDAMSELDNKYIDEALNYKKKVKKPIWIKWGAMVASLLLVFTMSVPALAAADFGPAYNLLYKVSPAIAQKLKPVSMSCVFGNNTFGGDVSTVHDIFGHSL